MFAYLIYFLKGVAIGAANVIPGVSGGTIAFITGIYERLIKSIKSVDGVALKLLFKFDLKKLYTHLDFGFLFAVLLGVFLSLISLGKLLAYLFEMFPIGVWSFFFGLILWSVISVGKTISKINISVIIIFLVGTGMAVYLALANPAAENNSFIYLIICGVVAIASMILPGLSGSFVLILLGNYRLIMLEAIPSFNLDIIIPVAIGSAVGFVLLSRIISYLLTNFKDLTISLLTGFILGSLLIIWPWKNEIFLKANTGDYILKEGEKIIEGYSWFLPDMNLATLSAVVLMCTGALVVYFMEKYSEKA